MIRVNIFIKVIYIIPSKQLYYRKYNNINTNDIDENEIERVSDTISVSNEIRDNINNSCENESIEYEVNDAYNDNLLIEVYHIKVENGYTYCTIYIHFNSSTQFRFNFNYEVRSVCGEVFIYFLFILSKKLNSI